MKRPGPVTMPGGVTVIDPGLSTTVQDLGRPGWARFAVSPSGAADVAAHGLGNRLVGNAPGAASFESVLGALVLRVEADVVVAVTGAPVPVFTDRRDAAMAHAVHLTAGSTLRLGRPALGLRTYVSIRGGIEVPLVLGSRSTDTLGGLGPAPVRAGERFDIGALAVDLPAPDHAPVAPPVVEPTIDLVAGPRLDWIGTEDAERLVSTVFTVSDQADRVGVRFDGVALGRRADRRHELASEPLVVGAMQVPPDGRPIVFGPDHPTTGGYPVVAVVAEVHRGVVAQLRPGQRVRFGWRRP